MKRFLWGVVAGLIAFPLLGAGYILSGYAPAAVTDSPFPLEAFVAGGALEAKIHRLAPKRDLSSFTNADLLAGAQVYRNGCGCHGLPSGSPTQTEFAHAPKMFPSPPQLFTPDGYVTDDPVGETYWKVKNGIRMTAMPSFAETFSDQEMWQVAALVAKADKLPPEVLDALKAPLFGPPPPPSGGQKKPAK